MKSKVLILFTVLAALTTGFFVGRFQGGRSVSKYTERYIIIAGAVVDAQQAVRALTYLKEGKETFAFQLLEMKLDHSLLTLGDAQELTPDDLKAIRVAREYRSKYPYSGSAPELKDRIAEVLSLAK
jgi:hypothetical protein